MQTNERAQQILTVTKQLNRLTVLREILQTPTIKTFTNILSLILSEDFTNAEKLYYKMLNILYEENPPHFSGHVLKDYVAKYILCSENAFTNSLKSGYNKPVYDAMQSDITSLMQLSSITQDTFNEWCRLDNQPTTSIALNSKKGKAEYYEISTDIISCDFWGLEYTNHDPENPILEEGYNLISKEITSDTIISLASYFKINGTGQFLMNKVFMSSEASILMPYNQPLDVNLNYVFNGEQYDRLLNIIDSDNQSTLIFGDSASGKSFLLKAAIKEFPELPFVLVDSNSAPDFKELFSILEKQPIDIAVLIDDAELIGNNLLKKYLDYKPKNVLIISTSNNEDLIRLFDNTIRLPAITLDQATQFICDALCRDDASNIKNICLDYQIETKSQLNCKAVGSIIHKLQYEHDKELY